MSREEARHSNPAQRPLNNQQPCAGSADVPSLANLDEFDYQIETEDVQDQDPTGQGQGNRGQSHQNQSRQEQHRGQNQGQGRNRQDPGILEQSQDNLSQGHQNRGQNRHGQNQGQGQLSQGQGHQNQTSLTQTQDQGHDNEGQSSQRHRNQGHVPRNEYLPPPRYERRDSEPYQPPPRTSYHEDFNYVPPARGSLQVTNPGQSQPGLRNQSQGQSTRRQQNQHGLPGRNDLPSYRDALNFPRSDSSNVLEDNEEVSYHNILSTYIHTFIGKFVYLYTFSYRTLL